MEDFDYNEFWNQFESDGAKGAIDYARGFAGDGDNYDKIIQEHVPGLIEVAKERGVNMIDFLAQLDALEQQELAEKEDAIRADNDGSELSIDSDTDADPTQDADEPAESQESDGQAGSGEEATEGSEGV